MGHKAPVTGRVRTGTWCAMSHRTRSNALDNVRAVTLVLLLCLAPMVSGIGVGAGTDIGHSADDVAGTGNQSAGTDNTASQTAAASGFVDISATDLPGSGTDADPYIITNVSELQAMEDDLDANYVLGSDVNASSTVYWNGGAGFDPIGGSTPFIGNLDGGGHEIRGLFVSRTEPAGTFATISGTVEEVSLVNPTVIYTGTDASAATGSLAATVTGTVRNVTVAGPDGRIEGYQNVGGVAGRAEGKIREVNSNISVASRRTDPSQSSTGGVAGVVSGEVIFGAAAGDVSGARGTGGIAGIVTESGTVHRVIATNSVSGGSNAGEHGGIVGNNHGTVANVSALGSVSGYSYQGGVVGHNHGTLRNAFTAAPVDGNTREVAGVAGANDGGTVDDAYWDINASGQQAAFGFNTGTSDDVVGYNTSAVQGQTARDKLNLAFGEVWAVEPDQYPTLLAPKNTTADSTSDNNISTDSGAVVLSGAASSSIASTTDGERVTALALEARVDNGTIAIGGSDSATVRVRKPATGETLTITPEATTEYDVVNFDLQNIYAPDGSLVDPDRNVLAIRTSNGTFTQVPVSVNGDRRIFNSSTTPFAKYTVEVIAPNGTVRGATEPKLRGIGYPGEFSQNSTTGKINIGFRRLASVDESWAATYRVLNNDTGTVLERSVDNVAGAENFTVTVDENTLPDGRYEQELILAPSADASRDNRILRFYGVFGDQQLRINQTKIKISLRDPESVTSGTNGLESQVPGIEFNRPVQFANGSNYGFVVTDEDTGGSFTVTPPVNVTTGADVLLLNPDPIGGVTRDRAFWIPQEGIGPTEAPATVSGEVTTRGVTNFSVALVNASTGAVIDRAGPQSYVLAFGGEYRQNSTSGSVEITVNRSVLPPESDLTATVYDAAADFPSGTDDTATIQLMYDPNRNSFVGTVNASMLGGGNYSLTLTGELPARYGSTRVEKFDSDVFNINASSVDSGGGGSGTSTDDTKPPEIQDVEVLNNTVAPGDRLVVAVNATDASLLDAAEVQLEYQGFIRGFDTEITLERIGRFTSGTVLLSTGISPERPNGTYKLDSIQVADEAGNVGPDRPFSFDFGANDTVIVDNPGVPSDTEPPIIENITLLNNTVSPGDHVVVAADVADVSSVVSFQASFRNVGDGPRLPVEFRTDIEFRRVGLDIEKGEIRLAGTIPSTLVNGPYQLEGVDAVDGVGNRLSVSLSDGQVVNVTGGVASPDDTTDPTVRDIAVLNDTVAPGDRLVVEANISDASSVVETDISFGIDNTFEENAELQLERTDADGLPNGTIRLATTVPESQFEGTYRFDRAEAIDGARNRGNLFPFDLETVPSFEVVDGSTAATVNLTDLRVRNDTLSPGDRLIINTQIDSDQPVEEVVARFGFIETEETDSEVQLNTIEATATGPVDADGRVQLTTTVPTDALSGSYDLQQIIVDTGGSETDFFRFKFGIDDRIRVTDGIPRDDRTPPTITNVDILNDSVAPGDRIVAEVTATDESALTAASVGLEPVAEEAAPGPRPDFVMLSAVDPDGTDGQTFRVAGRISKDSAIGRLSIDGVTVVDAKANPGFRFAFTEIDGVDVEARSATVTIGSAGGLTPGETVTMDLTAANVQKLYAGSATLRYDTTVLNATDISVGGLLTSDGGDARVLIEQVDNADGRVDFGLTRLHTSSGVSGSGTLASITFRVDDDAPAGARSALVLESTTLSDPTEGLIPVARENGSVATAGVPNLSVRAKSVSYVGNPLRVSVNSSVTNSNLSRIEVSAPAVNASGREACPAAPVCRGSPSVSPAESTWNGTGYENATVEVRAVTNAGLNATETVETEVRIAGDIMPDGEVGIRDAAAVGVSWRSDVSDDGYDPAADLTGDGRINIFDAVVLGQNFGDQATSTEQETPG